MNIEVIITAAIVRRSKRNAPPINQVSKPMQANNIKVNANVRRISWLLSWLFLIKL
jgi:hypothetical protein